MRARTAHPARIQLQRAGHAPSNRYDQQQRRRRRAAAICMHDQLQVSVLTLTFALARQQVQQAMRDARSNGLTRRASSSSEPATPSAAAAANGGSGGGGGAPLLAEGAETALLYVRFRAAAEPGLKGARRPAKI